jgi:hypothetical protein
MTYKQEEKYDVRPMAGHAWPRSLSFSGRGRRKLLVSEDKPLGQRNEITRREGIKRSAIAGAVLWSAPVIRAVDLAQTVEPKSPTGHDISYIALNVVKDGQSYVIKWEVDENAWDPSPGSFPACGGIFVPSGTPISGATLGFVASAPNSSGCVTITTPAGATVTSASKGAQTCCAGPSGTGNLVFCPC